MALIDRLLSPESSFQQRFFFLARRFVAGESIASAIEAVKRLNAEGMSATLDLLGEDVLDRETALATRDVYFAMLEAIGESGVRSNVSLKLTAMGLLIDHGFALENLTSILERAEKNPDPFVRIDMEGSNVTEQTLTLFEEAYARHKNLGPVLQAYLKRTPRDAERAIELGARVRLCKGAYKEPPQIALQDMAAIRAQLLTVAQALLARGNYPGIATHDAKLIEAVKAFAKGEGIGAERFEFQMLFGVRPALQRRIVREGYRLRVYVPFGTHWARYFYRRISERKENALFALSSLIPR
ncbi:MAG TPA: proline dehydrogenase [Myxococcales bacterium]|jgi:proline dehydrogenase|nr:proline dehydrogenase [Myxococcales bacterium]